MKPKKKKSLVAKAKRQLQKFDVYWPDPTQGGKWTLYGKGLSAKKAAALANNVTYILSPRWGYPNLPTKTVPSGGEV